MPRYRGTAQALEVNECLMILIEDFRSDPSKVSEKDEQGRSIVDVLLAEIEHQIGRILCSTFLIDEWIRYLRRSSFDPSLHDDGNGLFSWIELIVYKWSADRSHENKREKISLFPTRHHQDLESSRLVRILQEEAKVCSVLCDLFDEISSVAPVSAVFGSCIDQLLLFEKILEVKTLES